MKGPPVRSEVGLKVAIMQPYFLPYIGYFQLIAAVETFVIYDNIQYTKKGWINRNRYLLNGGPSDFTIPLKKDSDYLDVRERRLSGDFERKKLLNKLREAYRRAPCFESVFPLLQGVITNPETNLFDYVHHSVTEVCRALDITTRLVVSSSLDIDHTLRSQDKVLAICEQLGASTYINAIGGVGLYSKESFLGRGVDLIFIKSKPFEYAQFGDPFVPWLSIVDVMMFNPTSFVQQQITTGYTCV